MTSAPTLLKFRASSLRDCSRKAVYEASGAPARERSVREQRFLWRGKTIGHDYVVFLASSNGWKVWVDSGPDYWLPPEYRAASIEEAGIVAEQRIDWGLGTGHADAYIASTKTVIECLSSASAGDAMIRSKLLQAVLYTEHHPDATNCRVVVIDPSDFSEEQIVLSPKSQAYKDLVAEMHERIEAVRDWAASTSDDDLPARVCGKPSEAIGHFCQHAEHCFQDWEPPPIEVLAADADLIDAAQVFVGVKAERAELAKRDKGLKAEQDEAQAILEAAELPDRVDVQVGPFKVRRTAKSRKPTFEYERAEMAGVFSPDAFAEFLKPGASWSEFKAERIDHSGDEFGEVPF